MPSVQRVDTVLVVLTLNGSEGRAAATGVTATTRRTAEGAARLTSSIGPRCPAARMGPSG